MPNLLEGWSEKGFTEECNKGFYEWIWNHNTVESTKFTEYTQMLANENNAFTSVTIFLTEIMQKLSQLAMRVN